ncbi:MAG: plastocyanin/azurin family copper-binding protein [Myxococcales bacterium]
MRTLTALIAATLSLPALAGEITGKVTASKGAGGLVVYVVKAPGQFAAPAKPVTMDQKHMSFIPFTLPVLAGGTVEFRNSDKVAHNVFSPDGAGYNLGTFGNGQSRKQVFDQPGLYTQLCSLHPEMEGYVLVVQNPYYATTAADGAYTIKGVPDGDYQVRVMGKAVKKKDRKKDFPVTVSGKTNLDIEL